MTPGWLRRVRRVTVYTLLYMYHRWYIRCDAHEGFGFRVFQGNVAGFWVLGQFMHKDFIALLRPAGSVHRFPIAKVGRANPTDEKKLRMRPSCGRRATTRRRRSAARP